MFFNYFAPKVSDISLRANVRRGLLAGHEKGAHQVAKTEKTRYLKLVIVQHYLDGIFLYCLSSKVCRF